MTRSLVPLALLAVFGLLSSVQAQDPTNLEGGVLIAHYVSDLAFSEAPPGGMCAAYAPFAITSASQQVNRIDVSTYQIADWFVIAAWTEEKEFCGVQFGFGDYDPGLFGFSYFDACFPPTGGLVIPSAGWPGPLDGIAFVVTGDPWFGNYIPVYWFIGYAYGYGDPGVIALIPDPTVAEPFGGTGNCASPPEKWDAALGGMGINMDGIYVEPTALPLGACCVDTDCILLNQSECNTMGGIWLPGEDCEPANPCDDIHVCCVNGGCIITTQSGCADLGGNYYPEWDECDPNPCPAYGVCCIGCACQLGFEEECTQVGGIFHPEWMVCEPNPCEAYSPAISVRWGVIKGLYR